MAQIMGKKSFKYSLNTASGSSLGQTMPNSLNLELSRKAKALQSTEHQGKTRKDPSSHARDRKGCSSRRKYHIFHKVSIFYIFCPNAVSNCLEMPLCIMLSFLDYFKKSFWEKAGYYTDFRRQLSNSYRDCTETCIKRMPSPCQPPQKKSCLQWNWKPFIGLLFQLKISVANLF